MSDVIGPEAFAEIAKAIGKTAIDLCEDTERQRIKLEVIQGKLELKGHLADVNALDCLLRAIQKHIEVMPRTVRPVYIDLKETLMLKLIAGKTEFEF